MCKDAVLLLLPGQCMHRCGFPSDVPEHQLLQTGQPGQLAKQPSQACAGCCQAACVPRPGLLQYTPNTFCGVQPHCVAAAVVAATLPEQLLLCHVQGDVTYEQVAHMNITQFRQVMATAKLVAPGYSSDKVDDIFNNMAALCRVSRFLGHGGRGEQGTAGSHSNGDLVWHEDAITGRSWEGCRTSKPGAWCSCQLQPC